MHENEFLKELECLNFSETPLTAAEQTALEARVFAAIANLPAQSSAQTAHNVAETQSNAIEQSATACPQNGACGGTHSLVCAAPRQRKRKAYRLRRAAAFSALAACCALTLCLNASVRSYAVELPLVGDVFAWIYENAGQYAPLKSDQLSTYAEDVYIIGQELPEEEQFYSDVPLPSATNPVPQPSATAAPVAANVAVGENVEVAITQVFCDGEYLRMSVLITANDDSLAAFEWLGLGDGTSWTSTNCAGSAWIGGEEVRIQNGFSWFDKVDDTTFVGELSYHLVTLVGMDVPYGTHAVALAQDVSQPFSATIQFGGLLGYTGAHLPPNDEGLCDWETMLLEGSYISFTVDVTPDDSMNRKLVQAQTAENGIALTDVVAGVGQTQVILFIPDAMYSETVHTELLLCTADGQGLYPLEGLVSETLEGGTTYGALYDAVPEDVSALQVSLVNKNTGETLVSFSCEIE